MEVYEKINYIIKQKKMTKREFAKILRDLEPRLKSTDQPPIETTIYKYLNGQVSIPIEIISFIAEALDITEQELFDDSLKAKIKFLKYIEKDCNKEELEVLGQNTNLNIQNFIEENDTREQNQEVSNTIDNIIKELRKIKKGL